RGGCGSASRATGGAARGSACGRSTRGGPTARRGLGVAVPPVGVGGVGAPRRADDVAATARRRAVGVLAAGGRLAAFGGGLLVVFAARRDGADAEEEHEGPVGKARGHRLTNHCARAGGVMSAGMSRVW